ncbi:MAG: hypothetical protein KDE27_04695 [Planctomycetes bacterium]|nr:hypothetical protein [Planctomycetota bacterium]
MLRTSLALVSFAALAAAQDFVIPLGFGNASGPPNSSYPVARVKDQNGDGIVQVEEVYAFCTVLPTMATSTTNFMVDGRYVWENGNIVFYFCDSEDGLVVRGEDRNHNGVIDPAEASIFFRFGQPSGGALFSPDTLAVYRDTSVNPAETRVYVALDNSMPSGLGYTHGIHRLVDANGDGDAMDPGEQSMFVDSTMGLTVPGLNGPVPITRDFWSQIRVLPSGKLVAFAKGVSITGPVYVVQPEMNAWYGFTDNNGIAVPELWFNASTLNDLPVHPDFDDPRVPTTALFPNWDVQDASQVAVRVNYARYCDIVPGGGPNGEDVYYLAASYRTTAEGDVNLNGQQVAGLVYRVVDANANERIDAGEVNLYFNCSGQTYNGVPPISFNDQNGGPVSSLSSHTWGFSATPTGEVGVLYENGGTNDGIVTMSDTNANGVIDQGEAYMPWAQAQGPSGYFPPFHPSFGGYFTSLVGVGRLEMPGPFGAGITTIGDACPLASTGEKPVMEVWNGIPQIGNLALEVGCIRGLPSVPAFVMGDLRLRPTPLALSPFLPAGCLSYLDNPVPVAFTLGDADGTHRFNTQIPNNPIYVNVNLYYQMALLDPAVTTPVNYVTTNALGYNIQP